MPTYGRTDLSFVRGEGAFLEADDGRRFLDFGAGIAVNSLGHAHPHLVSALTKQAECLWHTSNLYRIPEQERLAQRLVDHSFADTVFFTNSGAEAIECAIKTARKYHAAAGHPERYRLITFEEAFHGRTLATIAAAGQEKLTQGFGPLAPGFDPVPLGDIDSVKSAVTEETAGILVEPIQGEGGIRVVAPEFLRALRDLCDAKDLLLIFDEVQTGVGRTGRLFAHEWTGITPDIMGIAKGIGGGFPLGACLATQAAAKGMTVGTHGSTYGGNPLAMAVGNAVLDVILEEGFLDHVLQMTGRLTQGLAMIVDTYSDIIEDMRGTGLMIGLKCRVANTSVRQAMLDQDLLVVPAGDNTLRLLPPLIIEESHVTDALGRIEKACLALRDMKENDKSGQVS